MFMSSVFGLGFYRDVNTVKLTMEYTEQIKKA